MEEDGLLCSPQDGLLKNWRWGKQVKDQAHLKQRIRDIPGLLKQGLHLRKKSVETPNTTEDPSPALCKHKGCSDSFPCAGRALRNAFLSHGPYPVKDRIQFARILRRSYVGVELVQWLVDQSELVPGRAAAACVWQVVMELGILLSVDHRVTFEDSHTYYQFSFEECQAQDCSFQDENVWLSGVRVLLQLVPSSQLQAGDTTEPEDKVPEWEELPGRSLQMEALERLTSTVQNELVLALAKKAQRRRAGEGGLGPAEKAASATESPTESTQTRSEKRKTADIRSFFNAPKRQAKSSHLSTGSQSLSDTGTESQESDCSESGKVVEGRDRELETSQDSEDRDAEISSSTSTGTVEDDTTGHDDLTASTSNDT